MKTSKTFAILFGITFIILAFKTRELSSLKDKMETVVAERDMYEYNFTLCKIMLK